MGLIESIPTPPAPMPMQNAFVAQALKISGSQGQPVRVIGSPRRALRLAPASTRLNVTD